MKSVTRENQADIIEAFNSTSRYLDDLLNIDTIYFEHMVDRIYPAELQFKRTVSTKIYDKRDDFDFDIVNIPFLDGGVPRCTSYGVYIEHLLT